MSQHLHQELKAKETPMEGYILEREYTQAGNTLKLRIQVLLDLTPQ